MQVAELNNSFKSETRNLLIILTIFDCSLIFRVILDLAMAASYPDKEGGDTEICFDENGIKYRCGNPFTSSIMDQITQYFWDYIPIMAILLFHKRNYTLDKANIDTIDIRAQQLDQSGHLLHLHS